MKIDDLMEEPGPDVFYSKEFRDTLEAHMAYFRTSSAAKEFDVEPLQAEVYDGDLFGFLQYMGIEAKYRWFIMRLNNFFSPTEFGPGIATLLRMDTRSLEQLRQTQRSSATGTITM